MINTITYPATVMVNDDPEKRGRIKIACVGLFGDEDSVSPTWVEPVHDWGWFYIPDVGELIEIEFTESSSEDEQYGQMSIDNLNMKWRSARHYGNEAGQQPTPINPKFTEENYAKRRGFATPAGHVIMFDDTEGKEEILISWKDGTSTLQMDKDGSIIVTNSAGASISMNAVDDKITATATLIELNGEDESAVLGDIFKTYLDAHIHSTGMGPSGPPITPMPANNLSDKVKLG